MAAGALQKVLGKRLLTRGAGSVDEALQLTKQADKARLEELGQTSLVDFQKSQGSIDATQSVDETVSLQVRQAQAAEDEATRVAAINPSNKDPLYNQQALTPDEYKDRLPQLIDPEFSHNARMISAGESDLTLTDQGFGDIAGKNAAWVADSEAVTREVFQGRAGATLRGYVGDSPYTRGAFGDTSELADLPMTFYHVDVRTDPTGRGLIQLTSDAREGGLHTGSRAATDAVKGLTERGKNTLDSVVETLERFEDRLFDAVGETVEIRNPFLRAVNEVQRRKFLRTGDAPIPGNSFDDVESIVDEVFEELSIFLDEVEIPGEARVVLEQKDATRLKSRLKSLLSSNFDSNSFPFITDVKQGLVMPDIQDWQPQNIAENLFGRGIFPDDELSAIKQMQTPQANDALQELLSGRGYDHIAYHNAAEDSGSLSLILFREQNVQKLYDPSLPGMAGKGQQAALAVMLAPLVGALNAPVREK